MGAISSLSCHSNVTLMSTFKTYLEHYEANKHRLPYRIAFTWSGRPEGPYPKDRLLLCLEIPPGMYPVQYKGRLYMLPFPWQYMTLNFLQSTPGFVEQHFQAYTLTTTQCRRESITRNYLPPYLPNFAIDNYCIGWSHSTLQDNTQQYMIRAVDESFALHYGLSAHLDGVPFAYCWLFYDMVRELCPELMNNFWCFDPQGQWAQLYYYSYTDWPQTAIKEFPKFLEAAQKLGPEWLMKKRTKLSFDLNVLWPVINSPHHAVQQAISNMDYWSPTGTTKRRPANPGDFFTSDAPNNMTKAIGARPRYDFSKPYTWDPARYDQAPRKRVRKPLAKKAPAHV